MTHYGDKIILDLCGGTGAWSRPYREAGYDVRVITLPEHDVTLVRFGTQGFCCSGEPGIDYASVYGILAAPPCTEFSVAKGARPRDLAGAIQVVEACEQIIRHCRLHGNLKFWAMENPRGLLRQFLGVPHYTFEQWQFGEPQAKPTDIWGYFNDPKPTETARPEVLSRTTKGGSTRALCCGHEYQNIPDWCRDCILSLPKGDQRAALRAITPSGFAQAFYRANK